ncbi:MAG TPA: DNA primase [Bacillus bacterium]|nr:DNA primase [Bacillus sp. (in: firmicutes)]
MKYDYDDLNEGARTRKRAKRRKTNLILNSLIVVVILLIVIVSANIFFGNDEGAADDNKVASENEKAEAGKNDKSDGNAKATNQDDSKSADEENDGQSEGDAESEGSESENAEDEETKDSEEVGEPVVTEGGSDANVKQTIQHPDWQPVGTTQAGEHTTVFDKNSADWQEMLLAYSYATGIDKDNMTVWWNENNGAPNTALGTISQKGSDQTYRVAIEWVEGQGWKPVKVEELIQNDKK